MSNNLLSVRDLGRKDIIAILNQADKFRTKTNPSQIDFDKMAGLLFFEPSTRTRIGFEAAAWKIGIKSFVLHETKQSSDMGKAECIEDTIRTLNAYASVYCIRHPDERIFDKVVPHARHSVINCGNGYDEHPSQALIDAYAIREHFGRLDNLTLTILGQAKYSRAIHSLIVLLGNFSGIKINEITPNELGIPDSYKSFFLKSKNKYLRPTKHLWGNEDIVYCTGFPVMNPSGKYPNNTRKKYRMTIEISNQLKKEAIILNPLPRIDEIDKEVDNTKPAHYFKQNELGLYVRQAILKKYA